MKILILVAMLIPVAANADNLRLTISGVSYHDDREYPYNESNAGLSIGYGSDELYGECGSYTNSFYIETEYCVIGGAVDMAAGFKIGAMGGQFTGYDVEPIYVAVPYFQYEFIRVLIAPGDVYAVQLVFNIGG